MEILCPAVKERIGKNPCWQRRQRCALKEFGFYTIGNWSSKFEHFINICILGSVLDLKSLWRMNDRKYHWRGEDM